MSDLKKVIDGGYCIGCGSCVSVDPSHIRIIEDDFQRYKASVYDDNPVILDNAGKVCPFSNEVLNEDELSKNIFDYSEGKYGDVIGYYRSLFAGHVSDNSLRLKSTSGGIITWISCKLIEENKIDAVIHVKKSSRNGTLFEYGISYSCDDVIQGAKSRYYPIEISSVINVVKNRPGKYAFVGLPCFVKSIRNYMLQDPILSERIIYTIGLVCGHLKSKAFADFLAWQAGIEPGTLSDIDFRYKLENRNADNYGICVTDKNGISKTLVARDLIGTNWGLGYFKYEACDYCDDIFAETADITVGDAWLNSYTKNFKGNSVIITRNKIIDSLIIDGVKNGELVLDELSEQEMRNAQGGGFRHRRSGLGYRLYLKKRAGVWAPQKRVGINPKGLSFSRKIIYTLRVFISKKSSDYWMESRRINDYNYFIRKMRIPSRLYQLMLDSVSIAKKIKIIFSK